MTLATDLNKSPPDMTRNSQTGSFSIDCTVYTMVSIPNTFHMLHGLLAKH